MITQEYKNQVQLLLKIIPAVAEQKCFALHGGTAINLFVLDMPRLSVDIDLTYLPLQNREQSLQGINDALLAIKAKLEANVPGIKISSKVQENADVKLICDDGTANVKIEVNTIKRGVLSQPSILPVTDAVQEEFGMFAAMPVVPEDELWGGKICAALDRQHPRDLFDMFKYFAMGNKLEVSRKGFMFMLMGHDRPFHEVLSPSRQNQEDAFTRKFAGMTSEPFTYADYEQTREKICNNILDILTDEDRKLLVSFTDCTPEWGEFAVFEKYPSIRWKLQNLEKFKRQQPKKHAAQVKQLKELLFT
ncbi:nucleotidyl transferase AbiEii/AbiGii toxin family protein [Kordiimonas pumila]|uniref:Nucleotidyl transferase AbiEii/AbiGii toxin family protein n=1 Tax=Kordiimonas pumila TaxID=2161677 RepID=A0ABV7D5Z5_9PROT|nr:nucleotidyl transferase AbiEii/AbiGii toxin family protein [Kordiimonas pumila]